MNTDDYARLQGQIAAHRNILRLLMSSIGDEQRQMIEEELKKYTENHASRTGEYAAGSRGEVADIIKKW